MPTISDPVELIIDFLFVPRLIYFCAVFAYDGLKNGVTLTHSGMKKGSIARLYGLLYLLACVFAVLSTSPQLRELLRIDLKDLKQALLMSTSSLEAGFVFLGIAFIIFLLREWLISSSIKKLKRTMKNTRRIAMGRKYTNWMIAMIIAIGILYLLGLPHFFKVGVFAFFTYFAPFTSPLAVKKLMSMSIDENEQPKKSVSLA